MKDKIITIMDYYWQQVAGGDEHHAVLSSMSTYIKTEKIDMTHGIVSGLGLWGSQAKKWSINFGSDFSQLEFDCECPSIKIRGKSNMLVPCCHCIRGLIDLESRLLKKPYEEVFKSRYDNIIPF